MTDLPQYNQLNLSFARFLSQRTLFEGQQQTNFESLIAQLSFQQDQGNSCIHLDSEQKKLVLESGLALENGISPLIVEQDRLYLQRYWFYEHRLALQIKKLLTQSYLQTVAEPLVNRYFVELIDEIDWQKEAAKKAICQSFCIISGGPGTGKTTTVVKILALIQEISKQQGGFLHIAMAAPTGKAAMRLQQSIGASKVTLPCAELIKQHLPETVVTLHRLLGARPPSPYFEHDGNHPLTYDLIVVDEASMVDLALMSKLVDALKPGCRLILLGDKDQLASVESGAVLSDLSKSLPKHTVELKKSYRFQGDIKLLADAVNSQQIDQAWNILQKGQQPVGLLESDVIDYITEKYNDYLQSIKNKQDFSDVFSAFNRFQVLCSNRHGDRGVVDINYRVEQRLEQQNKINGGATWYQGRPVMMTQNNSAMQLFNGDIGLCLIDRESEIDALAVFFLRPDGRIKKMLPSRVPAHETVYAMTIHKSQGSEFEECLCILPNKTNPVLTKELIYTAITRAKKKLKIASSQAVFYYALQQKVDRKSGLFEKMTEEI